MCSLIGMAYNSTTSFIQNRIADVSCSLAFDLISEISPCVDVWESFLTGARGSGKDEKRTSRESDHES